MTQRYAFLDAGGVLIAHGYAEANRPGDTRVAVADDFAFVPGRARWTGDAWEEYAPPSPAPRWTPLEFLERFTQAERIAIRQAAAGATTEALQLADWLDLLRASTEVIADDPRTVAGMAALVAAGLLTEARRAAILGGV